MYQLLNSKRMQQQHHSPFTSVFRANELVAPTLSDQSCEQVVQLSGNWINCKRPCDKTCGDGKKVWEVVCPPRTACSINKPVNTRRPEACMGQQCPWGKVTLPSNTTYYNSRGQVSSSDCGRGTQIKRAQCSIKGGKDERYCAKANCNILGQCSKPADETVQYINYNGCRFHPSGTPVDPRVGCSSKCDIMNRHNCADSRLNPGEPSGCISRYGAPWKDQLDPCRGGLCKSK